MVNVYTYVYVYIYILCYVSIIMNNIYYHITPTLTITKDTRILKMEISLVYYIDILDCVHSSLYYRSDGYPYPY